MEADELMLTTQKPTSRGYRDTDYETAEHGPPKMFPTGRRVLGYLRAHPWESFRLADIARGAGMTAAQVKSGLDNATLIDSAVAEDDDGTIIYVPEEL